MLLLDHHQGPSLLLSRTLTIGITDMINVTLCRRRLRHRSRRYARRLHCLGCLGRSFLDALGRRLHAPLADVVLTVQVLHHPSLAPRQETVCLSVLRRRYAQRAGLIGSLLVLRAISAKGTHARLIPVSLKRILAALTRRAGTDLKTAQLSLILGIPARPIQIVTSTARLGHTLRRLLAGTHGCSTPNDAVALALTGPAGKTSRTILRVDGINTNVTTSRVPRVFRGFHQNRGTAGSTVPKANAKLTLMQKLVRRLRNAVTIADRPLSRRL